MKKTEDIIRAAANVIVDPIIRLIEDDPHQWSTRPCQTCKTISSLIGKPFGCVKKAELNGK